MDNEDDEENEITAPSSPGDFPVVVENEVVVADNDEDVNININNMGINIKRFGAFQRNKWRLASRSDN